MDLEVSTIFVVVFTIPYPNLNLVPRSTESLDTKRKKYTLPNNPFKFGRS